jgi:hypothetical protein
LTLASYSNFLADVSNLDATVSSRSSHSATDARDAVTGGAYSLDTDAAGRIRVVDGTGIGEINTSSGAIVNVTTTGSVTNTVNANMTQIQGHTLAGAPTQIADGLEYFFNVVTPAQDMNDVGATGPTAAAIRAEMDANSTDLNAILLDTNELQTDDVPGLIGALNDFDPTSDKVYLGNGAHGGAAATLTLSDYSDFTSTNITQISGSSTAADNLEDAFDGATVYAFSGWTIPNVTTTATVSGNVDGSVGSVATTVDANVVEVSDDAPAAAALELFIEALGSDDKVLVSTNAQDLSGTFSVALSDSGLATLAAEEIRDAVVGEAADVWAAASRTLTGTTDANLIQINSTSIAGTGTQVADAWLGFWNVATPTFTNATALSSFKATGIDGLSDSLGRQWGHADSPGWCRR